MNAFPWNFWKTELLGMAKKEMIRFLFVGDPHFFVNFGASRNL